MIENSSLKLNKSKAVKKTKNCKKTSKVTFAKSSTVTTNFLEYSELLDTNTNNHVDKIQNDNVNVSSDLSSLENSFVNINLKSVGQALRNRTSQVLLCSNDGCKKNCCFYCVVKRIEENDSNQRVLYTKLPEHYVSKHSNERVVIKLKRLKKKLAIHKENPYTASKEQQQGWMKKRKKILDLLRIKANHLNNLNAEDGSQYVVRRRPKVEGKLLSNYLPCYNCTQVFSVSSLRKHTQKCTGLSFKKKHVIKSKGRETNGAYHELANESAIKIISKMRETQAVEQVRFDAAFFMWLNAEANRTEVKKHIHPKVRANISRLGTLMMEIKKINENITELSDIFNEEHYNDFIAVVKIMGKPHPDTAFMQSPATANDMFNLINHVCEIYEVNLGPKNEKERLTVQAFQRKLKKMWQYDIGSTILETQARIRRNKVIALTMQSDTASLYKHLQEEMRTADYELKNKYSDQAYERLRNATLCYLQATNGRRPGETERMEIVDYQHMQSDKKECLIIIRGKRSRGVPVVFDINIKEYLNTLVSCRKRAKISEINPYIFATIHDVASEDFGYVSACTLMNKFSESCKAENPETLRGTRIRMKIATDGMEKGIPEPEVQKLCEYLGHTPNIHKQNYRQSVFNTDIAISRQIREAQGLKIDKSATCDKNVDLTYQKNLSSFNENTIDSSSADMNFADSIDSLSIETNVEDPIEDHSRGHGNTNDKSISEASRPARLAWRQKQIDVLLAAFPNALDLKYKVPSVKDINTFISKTKDPILKMRSQGQIRSWMHLKRNEKKTESDLPERDHIPSYIYSYFAKYIDANKVPSHKKCGIFLARSPSKSNITTANIQNWVSLAIRKKTNVKNK
ncbi:uncharacterized protein LOC131669578 [Phymastichus coffea]|uniref:uncharacterized protein LOC131669578 n=1 Tax=Phymastichus coffea TaxID=108790 RepID=UPI00273C422B|nr:uncharacterized protein LOC131669578 [Phymastichus coffea]